MLKRYMMTPGPTEVPPQVSQKMALPNLHHRSPEFEKLFTEIREGLKYVFQTKNEVLVFASSGTGAMEASIANLVSAGDTILTVQGGKFGERWKEIGDAYGVKVETIDVTWGKAVDPKEIEKRLESNKDIKAVYTTLSETSTGVVNDIKTIGKIVEKTNAVLVVDAISGLGAVEMYMDKWNVDVLVAGSQKALMLPPGLGFAAVSDKAYALAEKSNLPKYYFTFKKTRKSQEKSQNPYTPAVSLLIGLMESINMIKTEGLENVWKRHEKLAKATRAGVQAIGLELFAPEDGGNVATAVKAPEGVKGGDITKLLRTKYGITIAGGQAQLKGKIFRISHLGYSDTFDIAMVLSALEIVLLELGHKFTLGQGVAAVIESFSKEKV